MKKIQFKYNNELITIIAESNEWIGNRIERDKTFYELDLLNNIKNKFNDGVVIDVGANIGNHTIFFSNFIFDKVYSFEPNEKNYSILEQNVKLNNKKNNIVIFNDALSDGHYNYNNSDFIGNMGRSFIIEGVGNKQTKKLDDFNFEKINLIKLDVEGHELKVLKGGINLINKDKPHIVLECNNYTDDFERVNPYMLSINYKLIEVIDNMFYYIFNENI